jgi:hypothetical protein
MTVTTLPTAAWILGDASGLRGSGGPQITIGLDRAADKPVVIRLEVVEGGSTGMSEDNDNSDALGVTRTRTMNRKGKIL